MPSLFDAHYCQALGYSAALLLRAGMTGYMSFISQLHEPVAHWQVGGTPFVSLMDLELRHGKQKPVIKKTLVDLQGRPFQCYKEHRGRWRYEDVYRYPGPIQYYGPETISLSIPMTMKLRQQ